MIPKYWYYRGEFPTHLLSRLFPHIRLSKSCPNFQTELV